MYLSTAPLSVLASPDVLVPIGIAAAVSIILFAATRGERSSRRTDDAKPSRTHAADRPADGEQIDTAFMASDSIGGGGSDDWQIQSRTAPNILVVDDSAVARKRLQRLLTGHGYQVASAHNGRKAIEHIEQHPIDLIITDLEMPDCNGFDLIAAISESDATSHIPILAITGHQQLSSRVADLAGVYGVFTKPWNDAQLLRRIDALLAARRPTSPPTSTPSQFRPIEHAA